MLHGAVILIGFEADVRSWEVDIAEEKTTAFCRDWEFKRIDVGVAIR